MNNIFTLNYKVTGPARKELVAAVSEITGAEKKYLGAPSMAYQVDYLRITREGNIEFDDRADSEEIETLIEKLAERGYIAEAPEGLTTGEEDSETADAPFTELTVSLPLEGLDEQTRVNLADFISGKETLIKHALGIEKTGLGIDNEKVYFPWFEGRNLTPDEVNAYALFISKLVETAKKLKRVNIKEDKEVANEKYAFRCFLLRIGFIGAEYKQARKILLSRLSGSAAFRDGNKKEANENVVSE